MKEVQIKTDVIQLDQFLKWTNVVASGGEAKILIQSGQVFVNGQVETRRSHKLVPGTIVELTNGEKFLVKAQS
ncbi:MAG: RNA-binding S4 domain-containing protein [Limnochordia bacterium]|jgi:ribosome-associated protein|nr:RNA-binding S4 domain-containing protein [Limnochordia bacterium]